MDRREEIQKVVQSLRIESHDREKLLSHIKELEALLADGVADLKDIHEGRLRQVLHNAGAQEQTIRTYTALRHYSMQVLPGTVGTLSFAYFLIENGPEVFDGNFLRTLVSTTPGMVAFIMATFSFLGYAIVENKKAREQETLDAHTLVKIANVFRKLT